MSSALDPSWAKHDYRPNQCTGWVVPGVWACCSTIWRDGLCWHHHPDRKAEIEQRRRLRAARKELDRLFPADLT